MDYMKSEKKKKPLFDSTVQVLPQDQVHSLGEISAVENNNNGSLTTISEMDEEMQLQGRFKL